MKPTLCVPRLLGQLSAATYLGISERLFEQRWRNEQESQPIRIGRRLLWDYKILDKWADEISGLGEPPNFFR